jgi:hypothetical protein
MTACSCISGCWPQGFEASLAIAPGGCHVFHSFDLQIAREAEAPSHAFLNRVLEGDLMIGPIETLRDTANSWECDENDHINVKSYAARFDRPCAAFWWMPGGRYRTASDG